MTEPTREAGAIQAQLPGFPRAPADILREEHYLGPISGGHWYEDEHGVIVVDSPTARGIPLDWLELVRWCLTDRRGSEQWSAALRWIRATWPAATTVVSYSDPSAGHTGALYRACGWLWAPTWHRLRPPPTGNGAWTLGESQAVKDRWVFALRPDVRRAEALSVKDSAIVARMPWAEYREPRWKRGRPHGGGGDYRRFIGALA